MVLDVVDVTGRHSLVTLPSLLGLPAKVQLNAKSVVDEAEVYEELQKEFSAADLSQVDFGTLDPDAIRRELKRVSPWESLVDPVVDAHSKLDWKRSEAGDLVLLLPGKKENIVIFKQTDGKGYTVTGSVNGEKFKLTDSDDEASCLLHAEMQLMLHGQEIVDALLRARRKGAWKTDAATEKQVAFLVRVAKIPEATARNMTKQEMISALIRSVAGRRAGHYSRSRNSDIHPSS